MPVSKQLQYDHHAYITPVIYSAATAVGANGVSTKFAAFTAQQLRRVVTCANIASVSSSTPLLFTKSGTTTTTTTLTAIGSAVVTAVDNVLATAISLAQGDQFWVTHGTDTALSASVAIETYPTPGSALACP